MLSQECGGRQRRFCRPLVRECCSTATPGGVVFLTRIQDDGGLQMSRSMLWNDLHQNAQARLDYALASAAVSAPVWFPSLADMTNILVFLSALGGFILICLRIYRQWKHRGLPPGQ